MGAYFGAALLAFILGMCANEIRDAIKENTAAIQQCTKVKP